MHVLVFENMCSGHRLVYLNLLLDALAALDVRTTVAVPRVLARRSESELLGPGLRDKSAITVEPCLDPPPRVQLASAAHQYRQLRLAMQRFEPDYLYVPTGDGLSQAAGMLASVPGVGLSRACETETALHSMSAAYPANSLSRRLKVAAALTAHRRAPWSHVHLVDAWAWDWLRRSGNALAQRATVIPDPIDTPAPLTKETARERLGIPQTGRYIGCVGVISLRKGMDRLIRAFGASPLRESDRLLLMGRFSPEIRAIVDTEYRHLVDAGRLITVDRFLPMDELQTALSALDVVCTPYPAHTGIASIMLRAAAAQRPVLSSNYGWLGWAAEQFNLGWTCQVTRPDDFQAALHASLDRQGSFEFDDRRTLLLKFHSPENFRATWVRRLRARLGLDPDPTLITWDSVAAKLGLTGGSA